jgi:serine/threonine-protein phosphatase 2A activator
VKAILAILDRVDEVVAAHPPVDNAKSRFGNPAFRDFYDEVSEVRKARGLAQGYIIRHAYTLARASQKAPEWFASIPGVPTSDIPNIQPYFCESWGNRTRIDYGSGMELNIICWL